MTHDWGYREAERRIKDALDSKALVLELAGMSLTELPESLSKLVHLQALCLGSNNLSALPEVLGHFPHLRWLDLSFNRLIRLPTSLGQLSQLEKLGLSSNRLNSLPDSVGLLSQLQWLDLSGNRFVSLPESLARLQNLKALDLDRNPLNTELDAVYKEGLPALRRYLGVKAEAPVVLNEAKLIIIGEGEVGKSCLLGALRGDQWAEGRPTTHGIEIKPVRVETQGGTEIVLNGWDFGGQRVYRPTHQLFFTAPAVYLIVWKPREGPQQGFVKEWIRLVKYRAPEAKILVVATHGGPGERQPDIDRQEIWDLFGRETVLGFFHVDSKPNVFLKCPGIDELKTAVARVAADLPEMGRTAPARWQQVREALKETRAAHLPVQQVMDICRDQGMGMDEAQLFVRIAQRLGHLIHYAHDPALRKIVILKPDWLATAISFALDDKQTRENHGLVRFSRLSELWNDRDRLLEFRYPSRLHRVFLRLMERFDLSYRVAEVPARTEAEGTSLIAQLVPDVRPDLSPVWPETTEEGDEEKVQICQIVDAGKGHSAEASGLFYQLIVRLHKYSLGRTNYADSVHWQRGLVLDDGYNGRALLEYVRNDVRITVRAPYPEGFLSVLTHEVKWLVESFWKGLRCDVMVPCLAPCGKGTPGIGLFEVQKLIAFKRQGVTKFPCFVSGCNQLQDVDGLLRNAPTARPMSVDQVSASVASMDTGLRVLLKQQHGEAMGRFDGLDVATQRILSQVDAVYAGLMQTLTDEAKEGPRLFSFRPVDPGFFDKPKWISQKFRLTLWCEHCRLPLTAPELNGRDSKYGVYELDIPRDWFVRAAPFLKALTITLGLVLPVAASATSLALDDATYKKIEYELGFGKDCIDSVIKGTETINGSLADGDTCDLEQGGGIIAQGPVLRQLQSWLKEKDPGFGGLIRVQNKRNEFLWVHPRFEGEY